MQVRSCPSRLQLRYLTLDSAHLSQSFRGIKTILEMEEDLIYENLDESSFLWCNLAMHESQDNTIQLWMSLTVIFKGLKLKFLTEL